jgi:hypothetical protein
MKKKSLIIAATLALVMGTAGLSFGAIVDWAAWSTATVGNPGSASGTIGAISVTYTGEVVSSTQTGGADYNYWAYNPASYISATVENAPPTGDMITLSGGNSTVNTISFSSLVTDPVLAIASMGQWNIDVTYYFDQVFTILSDGTGYWGGPNTLSGSGTSVLDGLEGNGTIQFLGTFSSISWTTGVTGEFYQGFTVGVPQGDNPVPLPGAVWLLGSGLVGLGFLRRKSHRSTS